MMKRQYFLILIIFFSLNSCVEEGGAVYCTLINESDYNLKIERFGRYDYNNKNIDNPYALNKGSEISFHYYTDTGTPCYPFCNIDSIVITNSNILKKTYTRFDTVKNPLRDEFYEGGETDYNNHVTTYRFYYRIKNEDFEPILKTHLNMPNNIKKANL